MTNHSLTAKRIFLNACLLVAVACLPATNLKVAAQEPDYESERQRAARLIDESKMLEALPIFEKLVARNPKDPTVHFYLGFCILAKASDTQDPAARKRERVRARGYMVRAKELGMNDALLDQMLATIPPDGGEVAKFSSNTNAEAAMNEGESAYTHGDLAKALAAYARALELDPKIYEAALFAGDMQFKRGHASTDVAERSQFFDKAGEWFTKAIAIDPNRETAYRYWGDALLEYGKNDEARDKFIDAIIADPYNRLVYSGLTKWAERTDTQLGHPRIDIPTNASSPEKGKVNITVDPKLLSDKDDGSGAWVLYGMTRALWMGEKFGKTFPNEKEYRHSLAEELDALSKVAKQTTWLIENKKVRQLDPSLANLTKLNDAGLLETYILFVTPDRGIARDYDAYRAANRDKLRRYWLEVAILK